MLLDRHRIAKLIDLADLERRVTGTERLLREEDVALLVKAAYDDASEAARAAFMARVQLMPTSAWPWSAVQVKAVRAASATPGNRGTIGVFTPNPAAVIPPALLLIRGEAESADVEPGNRLPNRGSPEAAPWEPLHRALDAWDTQALRKWIGPQGWISPGGGTNGQTGGGLDLPGGGRTPPGENGTPPINPVPRPPPQFSWRSPAVIVIGTTLASTVGVVLFSLRRPRAPAGVTPQQEKP